MADSTPGIEKGRTMEEAKHRTLWSWALLCLFVAGISVQQTFPIQNHDLFWPLAIGEQTLHAGHLLAEDPLTVNATGKRWLQHEWGAQLLVAAVSRAGGWWRLRLLRGLLVG